MEAITHIGSRTARNAEPYGVHHGGRHVERARTARVSYGSNTSSK